jgi:hydroxymethylpyrimidine pyrophosphatase-like HAD family hydrolase
MIKTLLVDLDGTILDKNYEYSKELITKFNELINKGINIIFVTGKDYDSFLKHTPIISDAIIENGTVIFEKNKNELLKNEKWNQLIRKNSNPLLRLYKQLRMLKPIWKGNSFTIKSQDIKKDIGIIKKNKLSTNVNISVNKKWIDVTPKPASKLNATRFLLSKKNLGLKEAIYIGDELTDIELLNKVGYPCTIANAHIQVKSIINEKGGRISTKKYSDGVLELIRKL